MHFPTLDDIDCTSLLIEENIIAAYKTDQLTKFKENCRVAFQKRVDLWMQYDDHGESYLA